MHYVEISITFKGNIDYEVELYTNSDYYAIIESDIIKSDIPIGVMKKLGIELHIKDILYYYDWDRGGKGWDTLDEITFPKE